MISLGELALVIFGLRAGAENIHAEFFKFVIKIAKRTGLGRAAARTRNLIPAFGGGLIWLTGAGIEKDHRGCLGDALDVYGTAGGGEEGEVGERHAGEVVAGAVVLGDRQVGRQFV